MLRQPEGETWTYEDYLGLPEDGNRYEIISGELHVTPAPRPRHQKVSGRIFHALFPLELSGRGEVFLAPVEVRMPGCDPVQPDLCFVSTSGAAVVQEKCIQGSPHLIVEVLSPRTAARDRTVKLNIYARAGVENYWLADPTEKTLVLFVLDSGTYRVEAALGPGDTYRPVAFPEIELDMAFLFP